MLPSVSVYLIEASKKVRWVIQVKLTGIAANIIKYYQVSKETACSGWKDY